MLFYPLYYNIISLTSLKITQAFHLLLGFDENQRILNSKQYSDKGDSYNRGPTVLALTLESWRIWCIYMEYGQINVISSTLV